MSRPAQEHVRVYVPWLDGKSKNQFSQFGEDGLIAAALEKLGEKNRWCFEVGASDGALFSNTKRLYEMGWRAVLIEADARHWPALDALYEERPNVRVVKEKIGSLDRILWQAGAPLDLDFGVIDIDGQEHWAWKEMKRFRPRLMLVEFRNPNEQCGFAIPDLEGGGQASADAIAGLGREKDYSLLATTFCNALFARADIL